MISASVMNSYCCRVTTIVYHVPQFTTLANDFYVDAVLCHLCPTPGNNEDNNGPQIMQNGYLGYFWDVPGISFTITTTMVKSDKAGEW